MIEYRSIADLNQTILNNLHRIPRDVDLIAGIPRSGLLAANMLALHLNLPLTDLNGLIEGRIISGGPRGRRWETREVVSEKRKVLVLDDSILFGRQMKSAKERIEKAGLPHEMIFGAVYASPQGANDVDIYFEITSRQRLFEWNIMHHPYMLERSCVDIDGVLCFDPTEEQNDDGPMYEHFLANAETRMIPTVPVGWLVTCRLERYRRLTEQWLNKHGVAYRELVMMDLPSKAARVAGGGHAKFKADVYTRTRAKLFIESSARQAREIAGRTGKPVFCIETRLMENRQAFNTTRIPRWFYRKRRGIFRRCQELVNAHRQKWAPQNTSCVDSLVDKKRLEIGGNEKDLQPLTGYSNLHVDEEQGLDPIDDAGRRTF